VGQHRVNRIPRQHPISRERVWLSDATLGAHARRRELPARTFNPKVAGSIPARPTSHDASREDTKDGVRPRDAARSSLHTTHPKVDQRNDCRGTRCNQAVCRAFGSPTPLRVNAGATTAAVASGCSSSYPACSSSSAAEPTAAGSPTSEFADLRRRTLRWPVWCAEARPSTASPPLARSAQTRGGRDCLSPEISWTAVPLDDLGRLPLTLICPRRNLARESFLLGDRVARRLAHDVRVTGRDHCVARRCQELCRTRPDGFVFRQVQPNPLDTLATWAFAEEGDELFQHLPLPRLPRCARSRREKWTRCGAIRDADRSPPGPCSASVMGRPSPLGDSGTFLGSNRQ
jgi:hypothetical protein